ncbi:MAG: hypothetical protein JSW33_08680 [bacterium]|nr:MAG: hypothetical protein JSW33_08680 [bacterium]
MNFSPKIFWILFIIAFMLNCSRRTNPLGPEAPPSTPAEISWSQTSKPPTHSIEDLVKDQDGRIFAATDGDGILFSSDNGQSWDFINTGLPDTIVYSLCVDSQGNVYAGTADRGLFLLPATEQVWTPVALADSTIWELQTSPAGEIFASSTNHLYKREAGQLSWQTLNTGLTDRPVIAILFTLENQIMAGTYARGIITSKDEGLTWEQNIISGISIISLGQSLSGHILAGTVSQGGFRSDDAGETWMNLENGFGSSGYQFVKNSHGILFCADYYEGVLRSIDHGFSWKKVINNLTDISVYSLTFDAGEYLIAGTANGNIFRTTHPTGSNNESVVP